MGKEERDSLVQQALVFAAQYERIGMPLSAEAERQFAEYLMRLPWLVSR